MGVHNAKGPALVSWNRESKSPLSTAPWHAKWQANSDIDLIVLGSLPFGEIVSALAATQRMLAREINRTVFPVPESQSKLEAGNHFFAQRDEGKEALHTRN